ncbi:unnamed protein product, partial [marine sediment metagenome]
LWIMAVLTNFTALQRMAYVWRTSEAEETRIEEIEDKEANDIPRTGV